MASLAQRFLKFFIREDEAISPKKPEEVEPKKNLSRIEPELDDDEIGLGFGGTGKTGMSFTLPQGKGIGTCPGETDFCKGDDDLPGCYGDNLKGYKMPQSRERKYKNYRATIQLLKTDPSGQQLGDELAGMLKYSGTSTMRIHDLGDFFSPGYARAWVIASQKNPRIDFWAYTRSYVVGPILNELKVLASQPNVSLWLSADMYNYQKALEVYGSNEGVFAGISFVQTDEKSKTVAKQIQQRVGKEHFINFLVHGNGGHVYSDVDLDLVNCPGPMKDYIEQEVSKENTKIRNAEKKGKPYTPNRDLTIDQAVLDDIDKFLNPGGTDKIPPKCLACRGCITSSPREFGDDLLSLQGKHSKNESHQVCSCSYKKGLLNLAEPDEQTHYTELTESVKVLAAFYRLS